MKPRAVLPSRGEALAILAAAVLFGIAFPPFPFVVPVFVCLVPIAVTVTRLADGGGAWRSAARIGFWFGVVGCGINLYWLASALALYTNLAFLGYAGTLLGLGLIIGGAFVTLFFARRVTRLPLAILLPVVWVTSELLLNYLSDLAFPWLPLGLSLARVPLLAQAADLSGVRGLSFWIAAINGLLADAWLLRANRTALLRRAAALVALLTAVALYGAWRLSTTTLRDVAPVAVVQPNIPQQEKWQAENRQRIVGILTGLTREGLASAEPERGRLALDDLTHDGLALDGLAHDGLAHDGLALDGHALDGLALDGLALDGPAHGSLPHDGLAHPGAGSNDGASDADPSPRLMLWPEVALPGFMMQHPEWADSVRSVATAFHTPIIFGVLDVVLPEDGDGQYEIYNAAMLADSTGRIGTQPPYHKSYLVPIVERVPFLDPSWFGGLRYFGAFGRGAHPVPFTLPFGKVGVLICYESIFPQRSRLYRNEGVSLLVNITNDAWFGRTIAPYQHEAHLALRAIENRVGIVRAANTGISGYVDPLGRLHGATDLFVPATRTYNAQTTDVRTLYVLAGDWLGAICAVATLGLMVAAFRRRRG